MNARIQHTFAKPKAPKPKMTRDQTLEMLRAIEQANTALIIAAIQSGVVDQIKLGSNAQEAFKQF